MSLEDVGSELRRAGRALRRAGVTLAAMAAPVPDPPPPVPPPTSPGVMLGGEAHRDGRSDLDVFREFQRDAGGYAQMRVTYTRGIPHNYGDHPASFDDSVGAPYSWLSVKTLDQDALLRFMQTIPPDRRDRTIVTVWHEPEDNIEAGQFTVQEWTAIQHALAGMGEGFGIRTAAVLMAWTWDKRSGRNPQAYADGVAIHPFFGIDGYDDKRIGGSYTGGTPGPQIFSGPVGAAAQWGVREWGIRECGTALSGGDALEWWSTLWDWTEVNGGSVICPWDSDNREDWPWCALTSNERAHLGFLAAGG